ncbi:MAG: DUF309 domain-containing protein [Methylacidiphilales bacterium]|nr:DUF309 domain-containing protein [Candidatus Methylacidiphilales bacterium]MDW8349097.1 DUF309 domain-containing protein [Verrucomicrobiae bacterium]
MALTHKSSRIAQLIAPYSHHPVWPPHYLGYFACFNQSLFYEAHDVLEELWLQSRATPQAKFYQGLIQFAGAFVHLSKNRLIPAANLLTLSKKNISPYPDPYLGCSTAQLLNHIENYLNKIHHAPQSLSPCNPHFAPKLEIPS